MDSRGRTGAIARCRRLNLRYAVTNQARHSKRQSHMFEQLKALFERLLAELPQNAAKINVYRVPKGDGTVIELLPANPHSASFGVHVDDEGIS